MEPGCWRGNARGAITLRQFEAFNILMNIVRGTCKQYGFALELKAGQILLAMSGLTLGRKIALRGSGRVFAMKGEGLTACVG